jgi:hypothetical protein
MQTKGRKINTLALNDRNWMVEWLKKATVLL